VSDRIRCRCPRCTIRGLMGPAVLITVGVLFLLNEVRGGVFDFSNTWPFILIVIGGMMLASAMAPMDGHIDSTTPPPPAVPSPVIPGPAPNSMSGQGQ
jgi:Domain of unknown function (DUF5668)